MVIEATTSRGRCRWHAATRDWRRMALVGAIGVAIWPAPAAAQVSASDAATIAELRRQLDEMRRRLEQLEARAATPAPPAAAPAQPRRAPARAVAPAPSPATAQAEARAAARSKKRRPKEVS